MASRIVDGVEVPMTPEEVAAFEASRSGPPPVPQQIQMNQARKALIAAGKFAAVDAALKALSEPARSLALADWEYASVIHRTHPLVQQFTALLGGDAAVDQLFIAAAAL